MKRSAGFILLCTVPLVVIQTWAFHWPLPVCDFVSYWASGLLFIRHGNPYSAAATFAIERTQGWGGATPLVMLCPPWVMPFLAPLALLSFPVAHLVWFFVSLILDCFSVVALWRFFGGDRKHLWIALAVLATFFPAYGAEKLGQVTPLMLAAMTAFLLLQQRRHDFAAGLMLVGMAIKPQLLYLVFCAILLWTIRQRRWSLLGGAVTGVAACVGTAILVNPSVTGYFGHTYGAAIATSCGIGGALRSLFGVQHTWLQFLPAALGLAWFAAFWRRHRHGWRWQERMPLLVLVSVASSPYCWYHDFILILPAVLPAAIRLARAPQTELLLLELYAGIQMTVLFLGIAEPWLATTGLLWFVLYWAYSPGSQAERQPVSSTAIAAA